MLLPSIRPTTCSVHLAIIMAAISFFVVSTDTVLAQTFPSHEVELKVDSQDIYHEGRSTVIVWEKTIKLRDAVWMRLYFDRLVLAHDVVGNTSSTLRITSLKDGAVQTLDATSCLLYTSPSPRDATLPRMPSSA